VISNSKNEMTLLHAALHEQSLSKCSIHNFVCADKGQELTSAIHNGYVKAVSDGSFKEHQGTSAFSLFGITRWVKPVTLHGGTAACSSKIDFSVFSLFGTMEEPLLIGWNGVRGRLKFQSAY
jgi:hypothetical protein